MRSMRICTLLYKQALCTQQPPTLVEAYTLLAMFHGPVHVILFLTWPNKTPHMLVFMFLCVVVGTLQSKHFESSSFNRS